MSKISQKNAVMSRNSSMIRMGMAMIAVFAALSISAVSHAADANSAKQIMKIVTPSGKIIYTDRELSNTPAGRILPLTGGQVLASEAPVKGPSAAAGAPQSSIAANAAPKTASSLVELATQQEASLKAQEKAMKEVQATEKALKEVQAAVEKSNCENAKKGVQALQGRVTRINDKGEKEILDDAQMAQEKIKIEQQIVKYCK